MKDNIRKSIKKINDEPKNIYENVKTTLDPVKIIYKYSNNNRKSQYLIYIFVGKISKKNEDIFNKIENLSLYDTLLKINEDEFNRLIHWYGESWVNKFFNVYHISYFINSLEKTPQLKKKLYKKYLEEWLIKYINKFKSEIIFKKINYSYSELVKFQYKIKMGKKLEKIFFEKEDIDENLYMKGEKIMKNNILNNIVNELNQSNQKGGKLEDDNDEIENYKDINYKIEGGGDNLEDYSEPIEDIEEDLNTELSYDSDEVNEVIDENEDYEILAGENESDIDDIEDIAKLYQMDDVDKNSKITSNMIANALENNKIVEKKNNYMVKFDDSQDNDVDNADLAFVFNKKFVYNQFILKDDSIKTVKNKICSSIKLNKKFCNENYLIPSRIYLWSEYLIKQKLEKVMIGQRWVKRNELLEIDVEPLAIEKYIYPDTAIKNLKDYLKRYIGKIRREDEDNNIVFDYDDYMLNDTIYMIDIYNELGLYCQLNEEQIQNVSETFIKIYFPKIKFEDVNGIIEFLNKDNIKNEEIKIKNTFDTIYNDQVIENEITDLIERIKIDKKKEYLEIFSPGNYITQSQIHINLEIYDEQLEKENRLNSAKINYQTNEYSSIKLPKLDLFRIFNDFTPDERYPFILYQVPDGQINIKYYESYMIEFAKSNENIDMITKWFENSPYGISFKMRLTTKNDEDKFMGININEIGKIEYKTGWREEDFANINDVINTYSYVKDLVVRINESLSNHPRKVSIKIPEDHEFRFAFINCIQKFKIPDDKIINHNDFSDFCIFFYPYIALVVEPRKRQGKIPMNNNKSKYGSYLRYKRVSKFENQSRIEQRILSYLKNFDFDENVLSDEISKQFNITTEKAKEEIIKVKTKFPNISKSKKNPFKKSDELPKFKPPGIGIDIQGKIPEKYKIRISGAREQYQLERIITFLNILIYLYYQTYIKKNPIYQEIKEKLRKLTNIAKRRSKVDEIVNYQKDVNLIKQMSQLDKKRLGFRPEEGFSGYSRLCQNSGKDKKRRPYQTPVNKITNLISKGFVYNKKTKEYEKRVILKKKGKKEEVILKAIKVSDKDESSGLVNDLYYSCDPEENGEHMYVGFLTRSNNPFGECMPCCFKKNPFESNKKDKMDFNKKCLLEDTKNEKVLNTTITTGDILYVLQDTNKIQEGRIGYLPRFIDLITNIYFKKTKEIKNHYLYKTDGYFFKFGIEQENYSFIKTIALILDIPIDKIKSKIINFLKKDTDENYYYSLNDGDIRAEYRINDFCRFIENSVNIDYYYLNDLLKIEGLFTKKGIFTIIFDKTVTTIQKGVEKENIKEDYYLVINNSNITDLTDSIKMINDKDILVLIKEGKFYYPLIEIFKEDKNLKDVIIKKLFNKFNKNDSPFIDILQNFFIKNVDDIKINYSKLNTSAREAYLILSEISKKKQDYEVIYQVIDTRFKCKYLITKNKCIIPVVPSGSVIGVQFICFNSNNLNKKDCFSNYKFLNIDQSNLLLEEIYKLSEKKLNIKPIGLFYDDINDNNFVNIIGIKTSNNDFIPVTNTSIPKKELELNKVQYEHRPLYHELDKKLANYNKDNYQEIDDRIININKSKYLEESYQLFKFELSNILTKDEYKKYLDDLKENIINKNIDNVQKILYAICTVKLNKTDNIGNELVKIIKELPDLTYYNIDNQRKICSKLNETQCLKDPHCVYDYSKNSKTNCYFSLTDNYFSDFIKKLSVEILEQEIKAFEILREKEYFVSDIVNYNNFTEKPGQKIIKSSNTNLQKILVDIFGKDNVPKIGRRHLNKKIETDIYQLQLDNPLKDISNAYTQTIFETNYSILRAYVNGYYWIKHELYTPDIRNLGYYSDIQSQLFNLFRSLIIDWLNIPSNIEYLLELPDKVKDIINNEILFIDQKSNRQNIINHYIVRLMEKNRENNLGLFELLILNNIHNIDIVILMNGIPNYLFKNNLIEIKKLENGNKYLNNNYICINLDLNQENNYPNMVEIIYYKK